MTTNVVLPEDVMFEILLLLPVMALLRFKSVCKSWLSLIQSPDFIDCFHRRRRQDHHLIVLNRSHDFVPDSHYGDGVNFSLHSGDQFELSTDIDLPGISKLSVFKSNMVICNGIVCFYHYDSVYSDSIEEYIYVMEIVLWNPATKQFTHLPQSPFSLPLCSEWSYPFEFPVGFGFDVNTNDYRVVRLTLFIDFAERLLIKSRVEVYSLNTDSWRIIDVSLPNVASLTVSEPTTPYRNGAYYCWGAEIGGHLEPLQNGDDYCIVSFDFTRDAFGTIPFPNDYGVNSDVSPQLYNIRDNIACVSKVDYTMDANCFEIWLLKEYGIKESWTKLYKVGPLLWHRQIGLSTDGRFLLIARENHLYIYDFVTQDIKHLLKGISRLFDTVQVAMYEESLFNIKRGNVAETLCK